MSILLVASPFPGFLDATRFSWGSPDDSRTGVNTPLSGLPASQTRGMDGHQRLGRRQEAITRSRGRPQVNGRACTSPAHCRQRPHAAACSSRASSNVGAQPLSLSRAPGTRACGPVTNQNHCPASGPRFRAIQHAADKAARSHRQLQRRKLLQRVVMFVSTQVEAAFAAAPFARSAFCDHDHIITGTQRLRSRRSRAIVAALGGGTTQRLRKDQDHG